MKQQTVNWIKSLLRGRINFIKLCRNSSASFAGYVPRITRSEHYCGGFCVSVLSSTLSAPLRVACAPLCNTFLVPRFTLRPAFLVARAVECAASLVSCLRPPVSDCANAPSESGRANTTAHNNFLFINDSFCLIALVVRFG